MEDEPDNMARLRGYVIGCDCDIVARLRGAAISSCDCVKCEAADEIERLREQRDAAMVFVETIVHDVDVLSTRPAAAIKLNDLVARINEWGDAARKILKESSETT